MLNNYWDKQGTPMDQRDTGVMDEQAFFQCLRGTLWKVFKSEYYLTALMAFIAEGSGVFYSFFISYMIMFIQQPEIEYWWGIIYVAIFITCSFLSLTFRNNYI